MSDGPFKSAFDADSVGVVRREIISFRIKNGIMYKESAVREYYKSGDYYDSQSSVALVDR
jgi:hypothetical protein